jgi:hypothetical protein
MRPRNQAERLWLGAATVAAFGIIAIGWFFLIAPQRSQTGELQSQAADADLQNASLQQRIAVLSGQKAHLSEFTAQLREARQALPTSSAMAPFLRSVQSIATATSSQVTSLSVGAATAVTPVAPAPTGTAAPTPAAGAPAQASGLFTIPITASVTGSPAALTSFLTRLQSAQPRAVLVTQVTKGDPAAGGLTTLQLSMSAFVAPAAGQGATTAPPGN